MTQRTAISLGSVNADFQVRVERRPDLSETLLAHDFVQPYYSYELPRLAKGLGGSIDSAIL